MFGVTGGMRRHAGRLVVALATAAVLAGAASAPAFAAAPQPGSYTGNIPFRESGLRFFVSASGTHLQDVYIPTTDLKCTGEGSASTTDHLEAAEIAIESGGAFASTATEAGRLEHHPVVFTFTFSGQFASNGEEATGTYREDIAFEGSTRSCTTGTQHFTSKRDAQPTQTTAAPPAGSYTGNIPFRESGLRFFVSANSARLQDVYIPTTDLKCTGEKSETMTDHLEAPEITFTTSAGENASFTQTTTEKGRLEHLAVVFTFTLSGHFHSINSKEVERADGSYREDITFEGSTRKCTTNSQSFSATRDAQPTQTTTAPPAGSYTGNIPFRESGLRFFVAAGGTKLQDVYIPTTDLKCTGEKSETMTDHLEAPEAAIKLTELGRLFTKKLTEKGILEGLPVVITFTFTGHFHSINGAEVERAAGMYREDITFEGSTRKCTTDNQSFSATRDAQPAQTTAPPPAGAYKGNVPFRESDLTFEVASGSLHLVNVRIAVTDLKCTGEGASTEVGKLEIAEIAIASKTTFKSVVTAKGTISGKPVVFTYTFSGHFHSLNKEEKERADGMYREDVAFEGSTRKCTADNQSFSAAHI